MRNSGKMTHSIANMILFRICSSYPEYHIVPRDITDADIKKMACFRSNSRFTTVVWRYVSFVMLNLFYRQSFETKRAHLIRQYLDWSGRFGVTLSLSLFLSSCRYHDCKCTL